ncbi:hypothetical protein KY284_019792 [Solanum tuberosum]|nr:hypothetical protein KY284_019792 [Solanum tuberosum]
MLTPNFDRPITLSEVLFAPQPPPSVRTGESSTIAGELSLSLLPSPFSLRFPPHLFSPCSLPSLLSGENDETNRCLPLVSPISESSLLSLSLNCSSQRALSNQHQQPARRATTSPANSNQRERQLRRATGETSVHQQQRQQRTSEILASPFLSSPTKFEFKDGSQ